MKRDSGKSIGELKSLSELSVIGLTLVIATLIGFGVGYWVERHWPSLAPWGSVGGALLGILAGFLEMFRTIRRATRRMEASSSRKASSNDTASRDIEP